MVDEIPEMVARVAEALRQACQDEFGTSWNRSVAWQFARVAIRAMREPTEAMLAAANGMDRGAGDPFVPPELDESWPVMIDAALGEHQR